MISQKGMLLAFGVGVAVLLLGYLFSEMTVRRIERESRAIGEIIDVDGVAVHLLDRGPRDSKLAPIILVHGASANLRDMQIGLGDRLSQDRRVIIVDRAGHGYSDRPVEGWRLTRQAELILGAATAKGVEQPIVVGQSFGGAVSLAMATEFQASLAGLVLLAPVSHEWPGGVAWYNNVSGIPILGAALRRLILPIAGPRMIEDGLHAAFEPFGVPTDYASRAGIQLLIRPSNFKNNAEDLRRLKSQIIAQENRYPALRLPIKVIAADDDDSVSTEIHAVALTKQVASAELTRIDVGGHPIHHTRTEAVLDAIRQLDLELPQGE